MIIMLMCDIWGSVCFYINNIFICFKDTKYGLDNRSSTYLKSSPLQGMFTSPGAPSATSHLDILHVHFFGKYS